MKMTSKLAVGMLVATANLSLIAMAQSNGLDASADTSAQQSE